MESETASHLTFLRGETGNVVSVRESGVYSLRVVVHAEGAQ